MRAVYAIFLLAAGMASAQSGTTVEGKVVSASDGTSVRRASVLLRAGRRLADPGASPRESYLAETDSSGRFAIAGVAPGIYECEALRAGFEARSPSRSGQPTLVTVAEGRPIDNVVLRLMPLGAIPGRVLDQEGRPVPAAEILAMQYQWSPGGRTLQIRSRAVSDDRGEFRLFGLYPGSYYLRADPNEGAQMHYQSFGAGGVNRGWMPLPRNDVRGPAPLPLQATFFPAALDAAQARAIVVAPGADAPPAEIRIQRRGVYSIRGRVVPADGDMVVMVERGGYLLGVPPRPVAKDGSFMLPPLPPGSYAVTAHTPGEPLSARQIVGLSDHDVDGVELHLGAGIQISGTVKVAGSAPVQVSSVMISVAPVAGGLVSLVARPRPDGGFTIPSALPDIYHLSAGPPGMYITSIRQGDSELPGGALDVRRSGVDSLVVTVCADTGGVDGSVLGEDGRPVPDAYVTLVPDDTVWDWASRYQESEADSDGRFSFAKLQPGRYTLFAWRDVERGAPLDPEFRKQLGSRGKPLTIEPNRQASIELTLIP